MHGEGYTAVIQRYIRWNVSGSVQSSADGREVLASGSIAHSLLGLLVLYYLSARIKTLRSGDRDCAMGLVCIQGPMVGGEGEHRDPRDHSQGDEQHDAKLLTLAVEEA